MGVPQSNFGRNCQLLHGIYLMILYEKKMSIKNQMAIYRLSLLFKVRAVYCILTKNRNVLFPSILNHFILAQGSFSDSSLLPNGIYLITEVKKKSFKEIQYYKEKLNFEGLKSLIESITKQLWPQLLIASWNISYHIKRKKCTNGNITPIPSFQNKSSLLYCLLQ